MYVEIVPTEKHLAQRELKKQKQREYLKKKKLTNREICEGFGGLSKNDQILTEMIYKESFEIKQIIALYLECVGHTEKFNKFVKAKNEESENQQQSENKEGT